METFLPWILTGIGAILTTLCGVVGYLWKENTQNSLKQIQWRDEKIKSLEAEEDKLKSQVEALEKRVSDLEKERVQLESRFLVFQSSQDSSPLPMWVKDVDGRVLACNKAYEKMFLQPRGYSLEDYIGHTDSEVWPVHIAANFKQHDDAVLLSGETLDTVESCVNQHGREVPVRVIKYPRRLHGVLTPIGVAGIAIVADLSGREFNNTQ